MSRLFTWLVTVKKLLYLSEVYFSYLKQAVILTLQVEGLMKKKKRENMVNTLKIVLFILVKDLFTRTTGKVMVSHKTRIVFPASDANQIFRKY